MPRSTPRRLLLFALVLCGAITTALGMSSGAVLAHNTLLSSDPADGASLSAAPTQVVWVFDNSVPLDTMTVTLIDASGTRRTVARNGDVPRVEVTDPLAWHICSGLPQPWRYRAALERQLNRK
jgi:methionine-rich copper-binding protein CopC